MKSESHKAKSVEYRFKADQSGSPGYMKIETVFYALHNPFNGHYEHTVAQNRLITPSAQQQTSTKSSTTSANLVNQFNNFPQPVSSQLSWAPLTPSPEDCKEAQSNQQYAAMAGGDKISTQSFKHSSSSLHPACTMQQHQQQQSVLIDNNNSYRILQYSPGMNQKSNSLNTSYHQLQTYNSAYQPSSHQSMHPSQHSPSQQHQQQQLMGGNNKSPLQVETSHQPMIHLPVYVSPSSHHQSVGGNLFHVPSGSYLVSASEIKSEYDLGTAQSPPTAQRFTNNTSFDLPPQPHQQVSPNNRHFSVPFIPNRPHTGDNQMSQMNVVWTHTENQSSKNNSNNNNNN